MSAEYQAILDHIKTRVGDRLDDIVSLQREFQEDILGHGPLTDMLGSEKAGGYFTVQSFALMTEIGEASAEIAWKPWAADKGFINHQAYRSELIDALHFLINLMLLDGMTADEIYDGYLTKQAKNRARQAGGYDGVSSKCPSCRRDYNDDGVGCRPPTTDAMLDPEGIVPGWCQVYGSLDTPVVEA